MGVEWLAVAVAKAVLGIIATVILLPLLGWTAAALALLHEGVVAAWRSEKSLWYHAGQASVYARFVVAHPVTAITALTAARALDGFADDLSAALTHVSKKRTTGNPPPEIPPIQAANLRMPTTYPFERVRGLPWPPFLGHRVAIGDGGA